MTVATQTFIVRHLLFNVAASLATLKPESQAMRSASAEPTRKGHCAGQLPVVMPTSNPAS